MRILPEPKRRRRLALWLAALAAVAAPYVWRTWWSPDLTVRTEHYTIRSTATQEQTEQAGRALETLYKAYVEFCAELPQVHGARGRLKVDLYGLRSEFIRCHPRIGWAEAFYGRGCCHAYYGTGEANSHHWLLHEAVHQLNAEVARLRLPKWIDEGLATYFATSRYEDGVLRLGRPDSETYPTWWLAKLGRSGDLEADLRRGRIIPLRAVISGDGGPDLDEEFNLYYVHWWTLTHFLLERDEGRQRGAYFRVIRKGGDLGAFESEFGPVEEVQRQWYVHLRGLYELAARRAL
jgi:hypothetical protein